MSAWSEDLGAAICELVADGLSVRGACEKLGVPRSTLRLWEKKPEFGAALASARRHGWEVWADEILTIGDAIAGCEDNAQVQAARIRIDSRKWLLSKLKPDQYGDRVELLGRDGKDLIPASPEAAIPRLMQVLSILLPAATNSELHGLATGMARKLIGAPEGKPNGSDDN
jgi:hypothetical protein